MKKKHFFPLKSSYFNLCSAFRHWRMHWGDLGLLAWFLHRFDPNWPSKCKVRVHLSGRLRAVHWRRTKRLRNDCAIRRRRPGKCRPRTDNRQKLRARVMSWYTSEWSDQCTNVDSSRKRVFPVGRCCASLVSCLPFNWEFWSLGVGKEFDVFRFRAVECWGPNVFNRWVHCTIVIS